MGDLLQTIVHNKNMFGRVAYVLSPDINGSALIACLRLIRLEDKLELESVLSVVMRFIDTGVRGVDPSATGSVVKSTVLLNARDISYRRHTTMFHHPSVDSNTSHRTLE